MIRNVLSFALAINVALIVVNVVMFFKLRRELREASEISEEAESLLEDVTAQLGESKEIRAKSHRMLDRGSSSHICAGRLAISRSPLEASRQ